MRSIFLTDETRILVKSDKGKCANIKLFMICNGP